jgi:hypothetical protein
VIAQGVAGRRQEIGVRVALGATGGLILQLFPRHGFDSCGEAKMELFDYIECSITSDVASTLGEISLAEFEQRANAQRVDPVKNCPDRSFPPAPPHHVFHQENNQNERGSTHGNRLESDQAQGSSVRWRRRDEVQSRWHPHNDLL